MTRGNNPKADDGLDPEVLGENEDFGSVLKPNFGTLNNPHQVNSLSDNV